MMSVKEYAAQKGVRYNTVIEWLRKGYVKAERTGPKGQWRIHTDPPEDRSTSCIYVACHDAGHVTH